MRLLSIVLISIGVTFAVSGAEHRFYAIEASGDSIAEGIESTVNVDKSGNTETITLRLRNTRHTPFQPVKAGLKLGVDTYMDTYPEWYGKFFQHSQFANRTISTATCSRLKARKKQ